MLLFVLLCAACCLNLGYLCAWTDLTTPCTGGFASLAALPTGWRKHQLGDTVTGHKRDPGLLMMTAGARRNDKTGKLTTCEMHTCPLRWREPAKRR